MCHHFKKYSFKKFTQSWKIGRWIQKAIELRLKLSYILVVITDEWILQHTALCLFSLFHLILEKSN